MKNIKHHKYGEMLIRSWGVQTWAILWAHTFSTKLPASFVHMKKWKEFVLRQRREKTSSKHKASFEQILARDYVGSLQYRSLVCIFAMCTPLKNIRTHWYIYAKRKKTFYQNWKFIDYWKIRMESRFFPSPEWHKQHERWERMRVREKRANQYHAQEWNRMDLFALLRIMLIKCSHLSLLRSVRLCFPFPVWCCVVCVFFARLLSHSLPECVICLHSQSTFRYVCFPSSSSFSLVSCFI